MGCVSSKENAENPDLTAGRSALNEDQPNNNQSTSKQQVSRTYTIVTPTPRPHDGYADEDLPPYMSTAQERSAELILKVLQQGLNLRSHDTVNAFNNCKHRRLKIWIDDNPALGKSTRKAILLSALYLFLIGKGTMCDMEFLWMSRSNLESQEIEEEDREKAKALHRLMKTDNWGTACNMINNESGLEGLGLKEWLKSQTDHSAGLQRHSTADATRSSRNVERPSEKHARLLVEARNLMTQYFVGWELKDIDMEELVKLDREAVKEAEKQTRIRNSVSFTLERETGAYKREVERGGAGTPTTVVLLVGSPIVEAEKNSVIKCQEDTGFTSKSSRYTVTGDIFCIQTLAFTEFMPRDSVQRFQQIDNAFSGNQDINDLTEVTESTLLEYGPTAKLFQKVLNSHLQSVDKSSMATKDMYGRQRLCADGGQIVFPRIEEVMKIFERDIEDSEDGNDHAIHVPGAN
ncbi:hypothetical protein FSARC_8811 [Fusarium sarcochroum]|uniref:Uncharacterized protein n=1 Tax=Fusarium sarcochroum TaxID=1208366 RepID=A0A8H4TS87_9HYPO|nr:hypothetical protein FSARC_8811 [Fusarium sarcochroum]